MRMFVLAAVVAAATPSVVGAQTVATPTHSSAASASSSATSAVHYSTTTTEIGVLLDDPAARAILDKHLPGMTTNDQVEMARAMTLKDIQQYNPDEVTDKILSAIDADFAKIPGKK